MRFNRLQFYAWLILITAHYEVARAILYKDRSRDETLAKGDDTKVRETVLDETAPIDFPEHFI